MEKYHAFYQWKILIYIMYNEMNETTKFTTCVMIKEKTHICIYIEKDETTNFASHVS